MGIFVHSTSLLTWFMVHPSCYSSCLDLILLLYSEKIIVKTILSFCGSGKLGFGGEVVKPLVLKVLSRRLSRIFC